MGVGVTVEFKTCLGSACRGPDGLSQLQSMGGDGETDSVGNGGGGGDQETAGSMSGSLPPKGETATVITSMDAFFHRSLGTTVVIAGYSSGGVSFYHAGSGTELASVDTGSSAVLAVKRGGQSIAFTDGEDVHFASSTKFTRAPGRVCRGSRRSGGSGGGGGSSGGGERAVVTALAFDAVSTGVLYVGFGTGDVIVRTCVVVAPPRPDHFCKTTSSISCVKRGCLGACEFGRRKQKVPRAPIPTHGRCLAVGPQHSRAFQPLHFLPRIFPGRAHGGPPKKTCVCLIGRPLRHAWYVFDWATP
ncbi:unnamed protein product, partial [Ectocarpus sp. 12 AP-2014]